MADRQWFAEGVQVFESGTEEFFLEGVQLCETAPIEGEVCWGHDTAVAEANIRNFAVNWTGTGVIQLSGDTERLALQDAQYMISEVVNTGAIEIEILQNEYATGNDVTLHYRHGATQVACEAAGWTAYSVPFTSEGYVQVKATSNL